MFLVDIFIQIKSLIQSTHSSVTTCHHQTPFDLFLLNITSPLKEMTSLIILIILDIMKSKLSDGIKIFWHVLIRFCEIMKSLLIVIFTFPQPSDFSQYHSICRNFCEENLVPFESLFSIAHHFLDISDLVKNFRCTTDNGLEFF